MNDVTRAEVPPIVHVAGWSNSGKTTLIEMLLRELSNRGFSVATIKHAHKGYQLDREGKDSHRHLTAGASATALIGPDSWALQVKQTAGADEVASVISRLRGLGDLTIVEGFKHLPGPRIIIDTESDAGPVSIDTVGLTCTVSRNPWDLSPEDLKQVADFCAQFLAEGTTS